MKSRSRELQVLVLLTASAVAVGLWSPSAVAIGNEASDVTDVAAAGALVAVGPEIDNTSVGATPTDAGQFSVSTPLGRTLVPLDPQGAIVVDDPQATIELEMPISKTAADAVAVSGDVVYVDDRVSTVVDVKDDGVRVMEVLASPEAPLRYSYDLKIPDGTKLVTTDTGDVLIAEVSQVDDYMSANVVGVFSAPWAVDAAGTPVPVTYQVADSRITMVVQHGADYQYPIVADPTLTRGDFQIGWSILNPTAVTLYANKRGTQAWLIGTGGVCTVVIALTALIPLVGPLSRR